MKVCAQLGCASTWEAAVASGHAIRRPIECTPSVQQLAGVMHVCVTLGMQLQDSSWLCQSSAFEADLRSSCRPQTLYSAACASSLVPPGTACTAPVQRMVMKNLAATSAGGLLPHKSFHLQPDNPPFLTQIKLPPDAKDLIQRLLCDVEHRLGSHGIRELKVCTPIWSLLNVESTKALPCCQACLAMTGVLLAVPGPAFHCACVCTELTASTCKVMPLAQGFHLACGGAYWTATSQADCH